MATVTVAQHDGNGASGLEQASERLPADVSLDSALAAVAVAAAAAFASLAAAAVAAPAGLERSSFTGCSVDLVAPALYTSRS